MRNDLLLALFSVVLAGCGASKSAYRTAPASGGAQPAPAYVSGNYGYGDSVPSGPMAPPPVVQSAPGVAAGSTGGVTYHAESVEVASVTKKTTSSDVDEDGVADSGGGGGQQPPPSPKPAEAGQQKDMLDIEANMSVEVEKVHDAAAKLREFVKKHAGQTINDVVTDDRGRVSANFTIRVPSGDAGTFLDEIGGLGTVRARNVVARDITKHFHDAKIYLRNLHVSLKRYEEILAKANSVTEILQIENEMRRIRSEIDRVKGDMAFMKDRAARATIHVSLFTTAPDELNPTYNPKAKLHPGIRVGWLGDFFRGEGGDTGFYGFGLSLHFDRNWTIDVEGYRRITTPGSGLDAFLLTAGGDLYSDFLGGGKRRFLNPYFGFRMGYARTLGLNDFAAGVTLGLEIYKSKMVMLDLTGRALALVGNKDVGAHMAASSALTFHVAF